MLAILPSNALSMHWALAMLSGPAQHLGMAGSRYAQFWQIELMHEVALLPSHCPMESRQDCLLSFRSKSSIHCIQLIRTTSRQMRKSGRGSESQRWTANMIGVRDASVLQVADVPRSSYAIPKSAIRVSMLRQLQDGIMSVCKGRGLPPRSMRTHVEGGARRGDFHSRQRPRVPAAKNVHVIMKTAIIRYFTLSGLCG